MIVSKVHQMFLKTVKWTLMYDLKLKICTIYTEITNTNQLSFFSTSEPMPSYLQYSYQSTIKTVRNIFKYKITENNMTFVFLLGA